MLISDAESLPELRRALDGAGETWEPVALTDGKCRAVVLGLEDLLSVVEERRFQVSGRRGPHGWWTARFDALHVEETANDVGDLLMRLAVVLRGRAREVMRGDVDDRDRYLRAALWVWGKDCLGCLGRTLWERTILENFEYDMSPSEPLLGVPESQDDNERRVEQESSGV